MSGNRRRETIEMKRLVYGLVAMGMGMGGVQADPARPDDAPSKIPELFRKGADVRLWAQVNRAVMHANNGTESEWFHVDNDSMPSRLGLAGE